MCFECFKATGKIVQLKLKWLQTVDENLISKIIKLNSQNIRFSLLMKVVKVIFKYFRTTPTNYLVNFIFLVWSNATFDKNFVLTVSKFLFKENWN